MHLDRKAAEIGDCAGADGRPTEPIAARMILGGRLRRLREERGFVAEQVAEVIRASPSKISRLELGRTGFKERDVADLLDFYEIADSDERTALLTLAAQANMLGRLHSYNDLLPAWAQIRLEMEEAATLIRTYSLRHVPWLLQTEDYARALIRLDFPEIPMDHQVRLLELVMEHQLILRQPNPAALWAVIDESVLQRPLVGHATLARQLRYLAEIAEEPHVTIQIMPLAIGLGADSPFTILRFADSDLGEAIYIDHNVRAFQLDRPADTHRFRGLMDQLCINAVPPTATTSIIQQLLAGD